MDSQHLDLLGPDRVGLVGRRRLHGRQRQELHEVVLEHVAHDAGLLVEGRRDGRPPRTRPRRSERGRCSGGSRAARRSRSRSAGRRCSGPSPSRGSGRSDRSASRGRPGGALRSGAFRTRGRGRTASRRRPAPSRFRRVARPSSTRACDDRLVGHRAASRSRRCGCAGRPAGSRCPRAPPSAAGTAPDPRRRPRCTRTTAGRSPGRPCVGGVNSLRAVLETLRGNPRPRYSVRPMPTIAKSARDGPVAVQVGDRRARAAGASGLRTRRR